MLSPLKYTVRSLFNWTDLNPELVPGSQYWCYHWACGFYKPIELICFALPVNSICIPHNLLIFLAIWSRIVSFPTFISVLVWVVQVFWWLPVNRPGWPAQDQQPGHRHHQFLYSKANVIFILSPQINKPEIWVRFRLLNFVY